MKKFIKNNFLGFILGAIIFGGIGIVYAAISATGITYSNANSGLKDSNGNDITNVQDAIDELYKKNGDNRLYTILIKFLNNEYSNNFVLNGLIPALSSNNGSNGTAFSNTPIYEKNGSVYDAYKAFNGDLQTNDSNWASYVLEGNYGYIGYKFNNPKKVDFFYLNTIKPDNYTGVCMKQLVLQGSNDDTNWVDLTDTINHSPQTIKYYNVTKNKGYYTSYRLYGKSDGASSLIAIHELQLYSTDELQ